VLGVVLTLCAFLIPVRRPRVGVGTVPRPWITGAVAFVLGMAVLYMPGRWGWGAVGGLVAVDAVFLGLVAFLSRRTRWSALHTFSLAAAGALDYGVHAFTQKPLLGGVPGMRVSNAVCLAGAVWMIWLGARRVLRDRT
jgi:heme O synthase-like polyprenyltransferase